MGHAIEIWHPNGLLSMSTKTQHTYNVENGFSCICGYMPSKCNCKKEPT